jgi:diadenosine tetraphosphate (Ap4A) HIT family hydrolase
MSQGAALSSTKIVHTVFSTQPYKTTRPFYALPQGESNAVASAVKKIIEEIATRFNDMYPLYVQASSHSNNSSSIIAIVEQHITPPRKHATRKRHKHDKRDP